MGGVGGGGPSGGGSCGGGQIPYYYPCNPLLTSNFTGTPVNNVGTNPLPPCPPPSGGSGWNPATNGGSPNYQDSCELAQNIARKMDTVYTLGKVDIMLAAIPNITTEPYEKGFAIFRKFTVNSQNSADTTLLNTYKRSNVCTGTITGISCSFDIPYFYLTVCWVHTHPPIGYTAQSAKDIYLLLADRLTNPYKVGNIVAAANGSRYAITVTDPTKATAFLSTQSQNLIGNEWNVDSDIGKAFKKAFDYYSSLIYSSNLDKDNLSYEMAMSAVLKQFNTGVTLNKKDASGNFKPLVVNTVTDPRKPKRKIYIQDCL